MKPHAVYPYLDSYTLLHVYRRDRLVECNLRLVIKVAKRPRGAGLDFEHYEKEQSCSSVVHGKRSYIR